MNLKDIRNLLNNSNNKLEVFSNIEIMMQSQLTLNQLFELIAEYLTDSEKLQLFNYPLYINAKPNNRRSILNLISDSNILLSALLNEKIVSDIQSYYLEDIIQEKLADSEKLTLLNTPDWIKSHNISLPTISNIIEKMEDPTKYQILSNKELVINVLHLENYVKDLVASLDDEDQKKTLIKLYDFPEYSLPDIIKTFSDKSKFNFLIKNPKNRFILPIITTLSLDYLFDYINNYARSTSILPYKITMNLEPSKQEQFIANIDKHCDSLLSRINKKIKEKDSYNTINVISNNLKLNESEIKDNKICKKLIANASLCRKGLNRPEEEAKINQDTLFKVKFGDLNYSYYGVCDGHGPLGHLVSDFIKSNLTFIVYKHIKSLLIQKSNSIDFNSNNTINLNSVDDSFIDFPKLFKESFLLMESKLSENKNIDIELSGTTCISLLFCEDRIISSNIGDSRAIKGFYNELDNKWEYIALSRDHKPSDLDEAERIKSCKGKVHPYIDDDGKYVGPDRVWNEEEELPGLAMSRSFGDEIAKKIGVYSEPEVKIFPYNEEDKFIVIASDGLWEYVSNKEVTDIVGKYHEKNDCDGAVSKLYEISKERWIKYDDYIDDISIIVAFLDNVK